MLAGCGGGVTESRNAGPVELDAGTQIEIGLDQSLSTARNQPGEAFTGTLGVAVRAGDHDVLPAGTRVHGHITAAHPKGVEGRAALGILVDSVEIQGKTIALETELIGGGAGLGTILNGAKEKDDPGQIDIPANTMFLFRLKAPVKIQP
jgi:hypothetical protein